MKVLNKIKNWFVEEYEEDEEEEEEQVSEPVEEQLARKVEVPKRSFRDRFRKEEIKEEEEEEEKPEVEEKEPVSVVEPQSRIITLTEEEEPSTIEPEEYTPIDEGEAEFEELPSRSSRVPLVFEEDDMFNEEEEEEPEVEVKPKFEKPLLYQGKREGTYLEAMKKESHVRVETVDNGSKKFKPSPIISPIYGILDKNYKKDEIVTRDDKLSSINATNNSIDNVRQKAYGEKKEYSKPEVNLVKKEKKVNVNNGKPGVSRVTLADADEYYNDLGLAYNEDYKDMSRTPQVAKKVENEKKDDDNLFDLIDSMYKKED